MTFELNLEQLKKKSLFVATPMYGGNCAGVYAKSTNDLSIACTKADIPI